MLFVQSRPALSISPCSVRWLLKPDRLLVAFLAGDGASYMAATTVFADGGIMQSSPGL